jgi:uncharacterized repeat protein (TIGR03803 family)
MNTNGSGYSVIHNFTNQPDGSHPGAGLTLVNRILYGTTQSGGLNQSGTVFRMLTNGTAYTILVNFDPLGPNVNGSLPEARLFYTNNILYGSTSIGGQSNNGTLFEVNTNGTGFIHLKDFETAADSSGPRGAVVVTGGNTVYVPAYGFGGGDPGALFSFVLGKPVMDQQPQDISVANGDTATFNVVAEGAGTLTYQWRFNTNTVVAGGTDSTLSFTAGPSQVGKYSVIVSSTFGSVTSSFAALSLVTIPSVASYSSDPISGSFSINVANAPQTTNRMWATTNLTDPDGWHVIATNVMNSSGTWSFTDPNTGKTNDLRFYRISTP